MEAINPSFLRALNENLPTNATINASFANFILSYYHKEGRLRQDIEVTSESPFHYYALLTRRGTLGPRERKLLETPTQPFISVSVDGVPLVAVFDFRKAR
jgi:hypothetical protein